MKKYLTLACIAAATLVFSRCHKAADFADSGYDDRLSGGAATVFDESSRAFTRSITGLDAHDQHIHDLGDASFEQTFVTAPAPVNSGLGPIFNNVSCISCHHNDGKGTPTFGEATSSMLIRMSLPGADDHGGPNGASGYGAQLQDQAIQGKLPEAHVSIAYTDQPVIYPDGSQVTLRKPTYTMAGWYSGAQPAGCLLSPRMAPPVFGLGLLELIPEATLLAMADENDADGDGISGRPNYVYDVLTGATIIGRFGLKASVASIMTQVASAYNQDMGITSSALPVESCFGQPQADGLKDDPELPDSILNAVSYYIKTLPVPARRNVTDPTALRGEQLFTQLQCASCHQPTLQTGVDVRYPALSNQRIHPYTDLLLHDMGDGLADGRPDYKATGHEWRTTPLWGIGLFQKTNGTPYYLHDGRARTLEEAVLWHDGEAAKAKLKFTQLAKSDRDAVVAFLQSL